MSSITNPAALREYLRRENLSQQAFARRLGVTQAQVSHWLQGKKPLRAERARQIHEATGGVIALHDLRADLWPAPDPSSSEAA